MPWKQGQSGNPGGNPKGLVAEIRDRFKGDAVKILETFRDLAIGVNPAGYSDIKASDRIKAGQEVIDRCLGKAPQTITVEDGPAEQPIDMSALSDEDLKVLAKLKFASSPGPEASGDDVH